MLEKVKRWAKKLKSNILVLYLAYKDKRTPWYAKLVALLVVGYAFSPIDLIPDFIPVLGFLDDVILLPLGILLATKLIPDQVMRECEVNVLKMEKEKPKSWVAGTIIILIWAAVVSVLVYSVAMSNIVSGL